ncbi:MAG TPA: hypothetical protein PL112_14460 [Candidatus Obscuribacter sp.]|jgi:hypothetical protein|nr:hypothetical protein [Candidatus Obscuribacter sp.]HND67996.1 hypothetical protein [Candidatus Obscuribacter sp.]HNH72760.1 hypothetical protein [Candidatus Obscuribacter sp.]
MIEATDSIKEQLTERAYDESHAFCYSDYRRVEANEDGEYRCPKCGSDDLMRELEGVGVEWGTDWIIEHLVREEGEEVDIAELYRDLLDEIYDPIKFGELEYSPSMVLESVDRVAFEMGCDEYADSELDDGRLIELNGSYYRMNGITE